MLKSSMEWEERTVALSDLKPYERNPRRISKEAFERLKSGLARFGYHQRILATPNMEVIGGHQRIKALQELGVTQVKVLIPSREMTFNEFRELLVTDNLPFGEYDFDMLGADFEAKELLEWGMPEEWLGTQPEEPVAAAEDTAEIACPCLRNKECEGDHEQPAF